MRLTPEQEHALAFLERLVVLLAYLFRVALEERKPDLHGLVEQEVLDGPDGRAVERIADQVGCNAETLRLWVRRSERDRGSRPGLTTDERDRLKALERENRELRQANEILRKASAYFAQAELDRRFKP